MAATELLRHLPLAAAAGWFLVAALQVHRDRFRTWTEAFFLFACLAGGMYAVGDWLFFNATSPAAALLTAIASLASLSFAAMFFFLFTLVYLGRMRRAYWALAAPCAAILVVLPVPGVFLTGVVRPDPEGLYLPVFNPVAFAFFLAYVTVFGTLGVVNLVRLNRIVRDASPDLARRTAGLVVTFSSVLVLGLGTNGWLGLTRNTQIPPPFSTLLLAVAAMVMFVLFPGGQERVSVAVRKWQGSRYDVKAAFLIFKDGTLIGSKSQPGEVLIDNDLLTATLDVIHNYTRTSFPMLHVKWLRSVSFGDYNLVTERVQSCYLTILLAGEESDQLRRQMRDLLREFEWRNLEVLARWRGVPTEAEGVDDLLTHIIAREREAI
ncbi:MAG: hypothetical protein ACT4OI_11210 [Methanobacteriota archaeon]